MHILSLSLPAGRLERWARIALLSLFAVNGISIFGFVTFTMNPILLQRYPWTADVFGWSYLVFARLQITLAFVACLLQLMARSGWSWLKAFFAVAAVSLVAECAGVSAGIPFGKYEYTDLLGPKFLGLVPYLIPISWFFMAVASYGVADRLQGAYGSSAFRIAAGAVLLTAWDLTLDPAMSNLTPFWVWESEGFYFGTPLVNLVGWLVTSALIMVVFELTRSLSWVRAAGARFHYEMYAANLMLPLGLVIGSGLWQPVLVTAAVFAVIYAASLLTLRAHSVPAPQELHS